MDSNKKWFIYVISSVMTILLIILITTVVIDPYFHYHAPLKFLYFKFNGETNINDGIVRNFKYNAIITGSSMSENFKTSEMDELFDCNAIKVPFNGWQDAEINKCLDRAYESANQIDIIVRSLDHALLIIDNGKNADIKYPTYLYNDNLIDDVYYIYNKETFIDGILGTIGRTIKKIPTTTFDEYTNWEKSYEYGREMVLINNNKDIVTPVKINLTDSEKSIILKNIKNNIVDIAIDHPETTFYIFIPPYSIAFWDNCNTHGLVDWIIESERIIIEELIKYDNVKLFSFYNNYELITNLDNYKDREHYNSKVNSQILHWMKNDEYLITKDNYEKYIKDITKFYNSYDYSSLYEGVK